MERERDKGAAQLDDSPSSFDGFVSVLDLTVSTCVHANHGCAWQFDSPGRDDHQASRSTRTDRNLFQWKTW